MTFPVLAVAELASTAVVEISVVPVRGESGYKCSLYPLARSRTASWASRSTLIKPRAYLDSRVGARP